MQTFFELLPEKQNTSAALGFFDGLHIGHRKVIGEAVRGSENGLVPICFTFAQSPKSVLKNQPQEALMSVEDKKTALSEIGIQHLYMCDFKSVVDIAPRKFVEDILIKTFKAKKLCCGFNYTFGKNGEGNTKLLAEICKENFAPLCETWMPDYSGEELYGKTVDVRLIDFIRGEKKFSSLEELKKAIFDNAKTAEKMFSEINNL